MPSAESSTAWSLRVCGPLRCFRVTPNPDPAEAFDGIGASIYPGRWNERNERAVYLTKSLPLGVLEVMVQANVTSLTGYGFYPVELPDDALLSTLDVTGLSVTWRTARAGRAECRAIGEAWRARHESVGLLVPSAVVPEAFAYGDCNIVVDPTHADFKRFVIGSHVALSADDRIQAMLADPSRD